ncbi:hypothetical protein LTR36_002485 [Oleoguttula mirabilis]|uniref:Syndecan n=1 Tax=Oleoguttula mirabilis TaxID=1507867 RepID=A0AAV9JKR9_9PEZI|nr:hypothetical protein LTR36_002485 [Oleoguttula mirabilis]
MFAKMFATHQPSSQEASLPTTVGEIAARVAAAANHDQDGAHYATEASNDSDAGSIEYKDINSHDNALKVAWEKESKDEEKEHTAPGVYDFQEQSDNSTAGTMNAVSGRDAGAGEIKCKWTSKRYLDTDGDGVEDACEPGEWCRAFYKTHLERQCCMTSIFANRMGGPPTNRADHNLQDRCMKEKTGKVDKGMLMTSMENYVFADMGKYMYTEAYLQEWDMGVEDGGEPGNGVVERGQPAAALAEQQQSLTAVGAGDAGLPTTRFDAGVFWGIVGLVGLAFLMGYAIKRRMEHRAWVAAGGLEGERQGRPFEFEYEEV